MTQIVEIKVPDIGGNTDVDVIEVAVKVGDTIAVDDTLVTLETDKATMDVPAEVAGLIEAVQVKVGDKVSEGSILVSVKTDMAGTAVDDSSSSIQANQQAPSARENTHEPVSGTVEVATIFEKVPDIGDYHDVDVIEVAVKVGDKIIADDTLITLETDKATMDVPATVSGIIQAVLVKVGDKVSQNSTIVEIQTDSASQQLPTTEVVVPQALEQQEPTQIVTTPITTVSKKVEAFGDTPVDQYSIFTKAHAGPAVRKLARELGVNLNIVSGTGRKGRIVADDVKAYVKQKMITPEASSGATLGGGLDLLPWPKVDFAKFGEIEIQPLSRIKKISGQNLARNWVMIPHVTQNDEADMTELEDFRKLLNAEWAKEGIKISPLVFIIKAAVATLKAFPEFNASLDGENIVLKKYYHIGFAADTPNGLVVPVVKDADKKGIKEIAEELSVLSKKAREGKLKPQEMQGATFTISSLGGIGGTGFTPIINAPEVAILGVCKSTIKPVWNGESFIPRLMCPLSLSYDHRVIDGASACRFVVYLAKILADFRRMTI